MSDSLGSDSRQALPVVGNRPRNVEWTVRSGVRLAFLMTLVMTGASVSVAQTFEVPEPPSLELPDLPVPAPTIEGEARDRPAEAPVPTQRRAPVAPESSRVDPPEPMEESPSQTISALAEDFEEDGVAFRQEAADAPLQIRVHDRTSEGAFEGSSERFQFVAGPGSGVYASYPLPKLPITEDLRASIYVRSNRPGVQIIGRVVLPNDLDPETGQPFYVNVGGTLYEESGRWRRLELRELPSNVERQARILRLKTNQKVEMEGAYLDRIVLNLYGGAGESEVMVDALRIAPVDPELLADRIDPPIGFASDSPDGAEELGPDLSSPSDNPALADGRIRFNRNRLELLDEPLRAYFPWLPTIIDAPGASPEELRRFGFDVFAVRPGTSVEIVNRAVDSGMLLMPMLGDSLLGAADAATLASAIDSYPRREAVAFWHLGENLGGQNLWSSRQETLKRVREAVDSVQAPNAAVGVSNLTTGDVAGELALYTSRPGRMDLVGAHGTPWGTMTHPIHYFNYLTQRRDLTGLTNVEALFWTWIPASAPPEFQRAIYGSDPPPSWGRPQILPEQIRIATAAALSAGYRGIGFRGDAELTRTSGRARLIELQLLNAEIDLFQEILARNVGTIHSYNVYPPLGIETGRPIEENYNRRDSPQKDEVAALSHIQAVGFTTPDRRGTLLLVSNLDRDAQWVPGQLAQKEVRFTVPGHTNVSAWEITLGGVRNLDRKRVPGGIELRLTDFGATAWVLLTPNTDLVRQLEQTIASWAPIAAQLAIEQAELQQQAIVETHSQLVLDGFDVEGSEALLAIAEEQLRAARAGLSRGEAGTAFANARRVVRPLQILMKQHHVRALKDLKESTVFAHDPEVKLELTPISAPPLMCFNTLPQLELFWTSTIRTYPFGRNLLPSGEFEEADPALYVREGWTSVGYEVPGLEGLIDIEADPTTNVRGSERLLHLRVQPAEGESIEAFSPVQDRPTVAIQTPPIAVRQHEFLRISVLVKMPVFQAAGSGGGVIIRDSIGGELMQYRQYSALPEWRRVVLYRRAPEDGELTVTLGLAATSGEVFFDDLRIERAEQPGAPVSPTSPTLGALPESTERIETAPDPFEGTPPAEPDRQPPGPVSSGPRPSRRD
ncbi:hypothetical protein [Tautonia marina]|uniref:hypothetical protein n=1 Tax=Tautonia marina TaxID=2653855 RepID=UPI001260AEF3|nr:hypothetical protein [Tautonia marina]